MNEEKHVLTDNEVDELVDSLSDVNADNDSIKKLHESKEKDINELLDSEEEQKNTTLQINPATGKPEGVSIASGYGLDKESDLFDDFLKPDSKIDADYTTKNIKNALTENILSDSKITDNDIAAIKALLYKKNKTGNILYDDLPEVLKKEIDKTVKNGMIYGYNRSQIGMARNMMANDIVENIYTAILQDKITEVTVDLETSVKNLVNKEYQDIAAAQNKQQLFVYLKKFPELAETKYKDDPEKKALLYAVSKGFEQAHSLEEMYSAYSKGGRQMKIRKIDIEKIHKVIREFESKYEKSTFTIRDISHAVDVLSRHVNSRYTENIIKGFIVTFCNYTRDMKPANIAEHTFMYYFINNILSLDIPVSDEKVIAYNNEFIDNVNHFLNLISERLSN